MNTTERKQWLATRKTGIGGSDAAAILGMSPWKSPMDVWLDKKGMVPERTDPDKEFLLDLGLRLEPVIAGLYERETHREIVIPAQTIFRHRNYPVLVGTPDRIGADALGAGPKLGVELKTENQFSDQFGEPGSDEVPRQYLIQCAHYMNVLDFDQWDIAVLHGGVKFSIYTVRRDRELEEMMTEQLLNWWNRHVIEGVPPDVDSSEAWRVYLHQKHPLNILPIEQIDPEKRELVGKLAQVRSAEKVLTALRDELENQLKELIGDREGLTSEYGKVTWKKTKDSRAVDWEGIALSMQRKYGMQPEAFEDLKSNHTGVKLGVRRFLFTPRKEAHGFPEQFGSGTQAAGNAPAALSGPGDGERGAGSSGEGAD